MLEMIGAGVDIVEADAAAISGGRRILSGLADSERCE
jgi:hypothetical protein